MNWSLRPDNAPVLPKTSVFPGCIGPREEVKRIIQARQDIPQHWRDCLCAEIDAMPWDVKAIKLAAYHTSPGGDPTFHIHLRKLY